MQKPTTDILERIYQNASEHKDGVYTRLYRYLLREDIYYTAYQKLYSNNGAATKGIDNDTADGFGEKYVDRLIFELSNGIYKPNPVRREYIKKPNGKMRPLGIPSFRDKLVQEVIRQFLEAIYEPNFSEHSHGFRPKRSCHTALYQVKNEFNSARWFIEGDIKGCFDNIDHNKLIEILERKIKDSKFINVIRSFLTAGYIEDFRYHNTYSGTPQGGILSPILANIYLNELDNKVKEIKLGFDKAANNRNPEYRAIEGKICRLKRKLGTLSDGEKGKFLCELQTLKKQIRKIPCTLSNGKRISYVRYADDFLIGVHGSKEDCKNIKEELADFLVRQYRLTLSDEKTLITHSSEKAKFLGYDISVRHNQNLIGDKNGNKKRYLNGKVDLGVPLEKVERFMFEKGIIRQLEAKTFKPQHRKGWLYLPDYDILERYNAELRGILNYYHLASNYNKLSYFSYLMEYSCLATLAGKHNSSIGKIKAKYRQGKDWVIKYKTAKGISHEKKIVKLKDCRKCCNDSIVTHRYQTLTNASIRSRLQAGICELCGSRSKSNFEVHHVPKVRDLEGNELWKQIMKLKNRKTIIVCEDCHMATHNK